MIKFVVLMGLAVSMMVLGCLLIGATSAGDTISAFTTNTRETTDVWIMDVSRMKYVHLHVTGQGDNLPVWSPQERRLTYFARNR